MFDTVTMEVEAIENIRCRTVQHLTVLSCCNYRLRGGKNSRREVN